MGVGMATRGVRLDIRLAVDNDPEAMGAYAANFPDAGIRTADVQELLDGQLGASLSERELDLMNEVGEIDMLVGGPPCQGFSDLNNHTRRADPRNALYARMARAAEVLRPTAILVENVPMAARDVEAVVEHTLDALRAAGYSLAEHVVNLSSWGVPQRRRRHIVLGILATAGVQPTEVLDLAAHTATHARPHTVRWAIADLLGSPTLGLFDTPSVASSRNRDRIEWLFEHDECDLPNSERPVCHQSPHSYRAMYGRLEWDEPAQTITTGFGSMGQGRYVHPAARRTLTPHEAARLQTFPDSFTFRMARTRSALAKMIGNAAPPLMAAAIAAAYAELAGLGSSLSPQRHATTAAL